MITTMRRSAYPEIQRAMDDAIAAGQDVFGWRVHGEDVVSISTPGGEAELVVSHRGNVHRFPIDPHISTKAIYMIWRATRV